MAPWRGPRHRSWASDTSIAVVVAAFVVVTYVVWEIVGTAPQGMVTLVGVAGGALFGAATGDKKKRDNETEETATDAKATAQRAEATANNAARAVNSGGEHAEGSEERASESELPLHSPPEDGGGDR